MTFASLAASLEPALLLIIFVSLALLGAGFFVQGARKHWLRIAGWVLFSVYWPFQAPTFFAEGDPVNAYFCIFAPLFILYIAYHEWKSLRWGEDPAALRWATGTTFVAAATYFVVYKIALVQQWIIYLTAVQSVWMLKLVFGLDSHVLREGVHSHIILDGAAGGSEYAVTVILACTAIQSIMIFVGAIWCLDADGKRKYRAYLYAVPIIYFLNLYRNAGIVFGYKILQWNPFGWGGPRPDGWRGFFWVEQRTSFGEWAGLASGSFEWMHSWVGKFGSLAALVVIALAVFSVLPELHSHILDLFDLPKRKRPGFFDAPPPKGGATVAVAPSTIHPAPTAAPVEGPRSEP